jgi:hypothetical protein
MNCELEWLGTTSRKVSVIGTAVKASQKTVFLDHTLYPSVERPINGNSTVTQVLNPINLRDPEDGHDIFSETSVLAEATQYKVAEDICNT